MHKPRPIAMSPVVMHDLGWSERSLLEAALEGLSRPEKALPCQFLYDAQGSLLFDQICDLEEYYPTRTEVGILREHADDIAAMLGRGAVLYELGSGSSIKTPILLNALQAPAAYVPIDVSREHLAAAAEEIALAYPDLRVEAVSGDYATPQALPPIEGPGRQAAFFPGSTIGNLVKRDAIALLKCWRAHLGADGVMVVGVDLKKDIGVLERAYNDSQGVTAAFIKNMLTHANRDAGADFDIEQFDYEARYDPEQGAVRMHLVSRTDQEVHIAGHGFYFARDERLHIEDSHKYSLDEFKGMATRAGFKATRCFTDRQSLFSVHVLTAED